MCRPITDPEKNNNKHSEIGDNWCLLHDFYMSFSLVLHRILLSMYVTCNIIDVIGLEDNCKLNEEEHFMW